MERSTGRENQKIIPRTLKRSPSVFFVGFPLDCLTGAALRAWSALRAVQNPALTEVAMQSPFFKIRCQEETSSCKLHNAKRQWWTAGVLLIFTAKTWFSMSQKESQLPWRGNSSFWEAQLCMTWPSPSLIGSFNIKKRYIHFTASARWKVTSYDLLASLAV